MGLARGAPFLRICLNGLGTGEKVQAKVRKGICDSDAPLAVGSP